MNKKFKYYAVIWAILLAVFNVICFATPGEAAGMSKFGGAFWAGYIFIIIAFIGQLVCAYIALNTDSKTKLFYNIPIIRVSYTGLIFTLIFGALCMAIPNLPNWVGIIVCLLILAFTAIAVIKAKAASDVVENIDKKVKAQTLFIKSLTVDAESLLARATTPEAKEACKKVYEAVRYSDPMSNDALAGVESQITLKFNEFSNAVTSGAEDIGSIADELVVLIGDRNKKCKLLK
ncbi:MAG TPA: hypothetical protein RWO09_10390 [Ruminococcus sp.]